MIPNSRRFNQGFSLIELTLMVGITASVMVLLLALVSSGLNQFRDSLNTTISSRIGSMLLHEAAQTDYAALVSKSGVHEMRFFDGDGNELPTISGSSFHAILHVQPNTTIPLGAGQSISNELATVTIHVIANPEGRHSYVLNSSGLPLNAKAPIFTYTSHVPNINE